MTEDVAKLVDRPFPLSRLHSSGQGLKTQAGLQQIPVTEEKAECGSFLTISDCLLEYWFCQ